MRALVPSLCASTGSSRLGSEGQRQWQGVPGVLAHAVIMWNFPLGPWGVDLDPITFPTGLFLYSLS